MLAYLAIPEYISSVWTVQAKCVLDDVYMCSFQLKICSLIVSKPHLILLFYTPLSTV